MSKTCVGVIYGGKSEEHDVSLISARNILTMLDEDKYRIYPMGMSKRGEFVSLVESCAMLTGFDWSGCDILNFDDGLDDPSQFLFPRPASGQQRSGAVLNVVFPVLHGPFGEDGTIQGLLEMADLPYVGSGVLGSALGMDKSFMKRLFTQMGFPTVKYLALTRKSWFADPLHVQARIAADIGYPCFVKPANLGSSVGVSKVDTEKGLRSAIDQAAQYDRKILVEKAIVGRELEIAILGNEEPVASVIGEILPGKTFYDYEAKYLDPRSRSTIPDDLSAAVVEQVTDVALRAFRGLECRGLARVDFFLEAKEQRVFLNEINTMPGFTPISMYQKLWEASGIAGRELVDRLIELALQWKAQSRRRVGK